MTTTDLMGSGDVTTVVIERKAAPAVADTFYGKIYSELEGRIDVRDRAGIEELSRVVRAFTDALEQVGWGEPSGDVTLTADAELIRSVGEAMLEANVNQADTSEERRRMVDEINAGAAILDQLEATR